MVKMAVLIKKTLNKCHSLHALRPLLSSGHFLIFSPSLNNKMNDINVFLNYIYTILLHFICVNLVTLS